MGSMRTIAVLVVWLMAALGDASRRRLHSWERSRLGLPRSRSRSGDGSSGREVIAGRLCSSTSSEAEVGNDTAAPFGTATEEGNEPPLSAETFPALTASSSSTPAPEIPISADILNFEDMDPTDRTALAIETASFISDALRARGMSMEDIRMRAAALRQSLEDPEAASPPDMVTEEHERSEAPPPHSAASGSTDGPLSSNLNAGETAAQEQFNSLPPEAQAPMSTVLGSMAQLVRLAVSAEGRLPAHVHRNKR